MSDQYFLFPHNDDYRFAPNIWLRSALFGALPPGKARMVCAESPSTQLPSLKNLTVAMTHWEVFDQSDLDVLLTLLGEAAIREADSGKPVSALSLPMRGLLVATGRQDGGKNRDWLRLSLERMTKSQLIFGISGEDAMSTECGSLISASANSRTADITLGDAIRELYKTGFTAINWVERQQLSPLGKWLHAFYSSHGRSPLPIKVQTIRKLCGRGQDEMGMASTFRNTLVGELRALAKVTKWECKITDGKVIVRKPTEGLGGNAQSMAKYLAQLAAEDWLGDEI